MNAPPLLPTICANAAFFAQGKHPYRYPTSQEFRVASLIHNAVAFAGAVNIRYYHMISKTIVFISILLS